MAELEQEPSSSGSSSKLLGAAILVGFGTCACSAPTTGSPAPPAHVGVVMDVVDGDTLDLEIEGVTERVRLIGIDTPESVSNTTPDQCFGSEATEALRGLLPIDAQVDIERDIEARDRYGRLLLYVRRSSDGLFVNRWMIDSGFANAVAYAPNDRLAPVFLQAETGARARGDGLWSRCDGPDQPLE